MIIRLTSFFSDDIIFFETGCLQMTVKEKVIKLLDDCKDTYLSGEEIADRIDCTRGAVWKAVKSLQEDGYNISAVTNKGYCLDSNSDVLSVDGIKKYLSEKNHQLDITVYKTIDSTNNALLELAGKGADEGTVVISGEQTKGKGRLGRSFYSPSDTGLYMSILLRPQMNAEDAIKITTAAAVAVANAVENVSGKRTDIKWVNDVYLNRKKICGILTEAAFNMECGGLDYAVLGIGINAYEPQNGFPEEIKNIAGAVFDHKQSDMRNKLAAEVLNEFFKYYSGLHDSSYYDSYRKRLMWINEKINLISGDKKTPATMLDVDRDCRLKVRLQDGTEKTISSGEISIRKA